jgi:transcriptional regulator with XRE-family HTH domain
VTRTKLALERRRAFGRNVRDLRLKAGFSQEVLGERAGLHRTYIGSVERGERNLALDAIWQLADALGVDPSALISPPVVSP